MALVELLDGCHGQFLAGRVEEGMETLVKGMFHLRSSISGTAWDELVHSVCRQHPICSALHQDPFTNRSFKKPRGYSGDAVMLDMIYGRTIDEPDRNELGHSIFRYTAGFGRSPQAVRHRRSLLANSADEISQRSAKPRILSIASGHLREVELSAAFTAGAIQEWVAIDQDEESLLECARSYEGTSVRAIKCSVRKILAGKLALGAFDFVYAAGLFDYLTAPIAGALISRMFEMLKPHGKLLVANFLTGFTDAGYMEAFMDWKLVYRTKPEMTALLEVLDENTATNMRTFTDPMNAIVYATAEKK